MGIATRDGKVSCQGLFVCEHQSFMTGDNIALDLSWRRGSKEKKGNEEVNGVYTKEMGENTSRCLTHLV